MTAEAPLVYSVGLDALLAKAVYADLPNAEIRRKRRPKGGRLPGWNGPDPDLLLLDLSLVDPEQELSAAPEAWGKSTLVVGLSRESPFARIWQRQEPVDVVEIGPGFLASLMR